MIFLKSRYSDLENVFEIRNPNKFYYLNIRLILFLL